MTISFPPASLNPSAKMPQAKTPNQRSTTRFGHEAIHPENLHAVSSVSLFHISKDGKQAIPINPLTDLSPKTPDGKYYNMVVEIPGGTLQKTEMDDKSGRIVPDVKNNQFRYVDSAYPANYGSIPQTVSSKAKGGDGDPLDVFNISPPQPRGQVQPVRIVGGIDMQDGGERDIKLIGLTPTGPLSNVHTFNDLLEKYPVIVEVLETWLRHYKGPKGGIQITGRLDEKQAQSLIEEGHKDWKEEQKKLTTLLA